MRSAVIDFETTGLLKPQPRFDAQPCITQIGAVVVDDQFNELATYKTLINPDIDERLWDADAIKTTGIGPATVRDAPTFFLAFHDFAQVVLGSDQWVGFNSEFDKQVLWWQLQRVGFERDFPWPPKTIDVMKMAARKLELQGRRGVKNPTLSDAYETFVGEKLIDAHDALADVRATIGVWKKL